MNDTQKSHKVFREKSKNVHTGVRGELFLTSDYEIQNEDSFKVTYNPYLFNTFVKKENVEQKVISSNFVHMFSDRTVIAV